MDTDIEPKKTRTVSFSVTEEEAQSINGWLSDALQISFNTPYSRDKIMKMRDAFRKVAEGR
jgi:hypothetical protein